MSSSGRTPPNAGTAETASVAAAAAPIAVPASVSPVTQSVPELECWPLPGLLVKDGVRKTRDRPVVAVSHGTAVGKWPLESLPLSARCF